ncbi:MAG: ABC transporter ATP-binding protein [Ardenticatenaceae bacterium]|nr:ABC transporter ATP-binding protein [Anaerolineales bacterium]MCB9005958.1 ABC transporter ATP-binding protein [Ardenticatenaceae bacterium]
MTTPLAELINVSKTYGKRSTKPAVSDISFTLDSGEILALLGPNGAGKTTTIKMLLGLVTPSDGQVTVHGYDTAVPWQRQRAMPHVGAVLEGARNIYWRLSPTANLRYFGTLRGVPKQELAQRIDFWLNRLDLQDVAHKEVRFFSRGMQQKVAIAAALLHEPDILLLDEPTLGLDVQAAKLMENVIVELAGQGKAILLTTHTMTLAERLASRILILTGGQTIAYGDTEALRQQIPQETAVEIHLNEGMNEHDAATFEIRYPNLQVTHQNGSTTLIWPGATQLQIMQLFADLDAHAYVVNRIERREQNLEELFLRLLQNPQETPHLAPALAKQVQIRVHPR